MVLALQKWKTNGMIRISHRLRETRAQDKCTEVGGLDLKTELGGVETD